MEKISGPVKQDILLEAGIHIGTKLRTNDMRAFVFKRRDDGLYILDLRQTSERILNAAKMMAKYKPEEILVVASRVYSSGPASKFASLTGVKVIKGRFVPGTMTNLTSKQFREPKLVLVCDPKGEREAIVESAKNGVPVIALCDSDNETKFIDLVIPVNNKGRRSLALVFYILSRELMMSQGKIKSYDEFEHDLNYFERMIEKEEEEKLEEATEAAEEVVEETQEIKEEVKKLEKEEKKAEEKKEVKKIEEKKPEPKKEEKAKEGPKKEEKAKEEKKEKPKKTSKKKTTKKKSEKKEKAKE